MIIVRKTQMQAMARALFEQWVQAHARQFFPDQCRSVAPGDFAVLVRNAIDKAQSYGFLDQADCCRYVDLTLVFGAQFDVDPRFSWAGGILGDLNFENAAMRMWALHTAACEHESALAGKAAQHA